MPGKRGVKENDGMVPITGYIGGDNLPMGFTAEK
jgi:hypothetical protein